MPPATTHAGLSILLDSRREAINPLTSTSSGAHIVNNRYSGCSDSGPVGQGVHPCT